MPRKDIMNIFTKHPASVKETYTQHLVFASKLGLRMVLLGVIAITHGILPFLFEKTASTGVARLYKNFKSGKR